LLVLLRKPLFATAKRQLPRTLCDIKSEVYENDKLSFVNNLQYFMNFNA